MSFLLIFRIRALLRRFVLSERSLELSPEFPAFGQVLQLQLNSALFKGQVVLSIVTADIHGDFGSTLRLAADVLP